MKTKAISSIFLLFTLVVGMISMSPASFADHSEIIITPITGSGSPGCERTEEGCYNPSTVTINIGSVVIFSNTDNDSLHTFTSGIPSDDIIGIDFDSGMLSPGDSVEWNPTEVGEFPYFDMIHPWMQGLIIVQEEGEETHTEAVVEETVEEAVVEETVEEAVVEETVEEAVVEETVEEAVVEETVEEAVVEETVEEAVVEETVEEAVVEETVTVVATQESEEEGGGCLIATAAYGFRDGTTSSIA